jgi:hypothetical protein
MTLALSERMQHVVAVRLPGMTTAQGPVISLERALEPLDGAAWLDATRERLLSSIRRRWMPVYRMADGEFRFAVGWRPPRPQTPRAALRYIAWRTGLLRRSHVKTVWGEQYSVDERSMLMPAYQRYLREIAEAGCLAMFMGTCGETSFPEYVGPVCDWFDEAGVPVNASSYVPFLFVLTLLAGTGSQAFYQGRHILVVSAISDPEKARIEQALRRRGAASVQFASISSSHSMLDDVDLASVSRPVDVAYLAAGIGAANVLVKLRPLGTLCVDVGALVRAWIDPGVRPHGFLNVAAPGPMTQDAEGDRV